MEILLKQLNTSLKELGKNIELFREYKNIFGEQRLASDLNMFMNDARSKGKGVPYVIGILKNRVLDHTQVKISYESNSVIKK